MTRPAVLAQDQELAFHTLTFVPDGDDVLVGRPDLESYALIPSDGAEVLRRLVDGSPPTEVASWYEATYCMPLDIADFLNTVGELGFLREPGDEPAAEPKPVRGQRTARAVFSPLAFAVYAIVVALWIALVCVHPDLRPAPRFVLFTNSLVLVQLLIVFGQIPWLFLHEGAHVFAGRRLGLRSELGFGTRLYFVVFETRMPSLLSVTKRKRYLPFAAGMLLDVVAISVLGIIAFACRNGGAIRHSVAVLALAMEFPICTRFAYQFLLFLQTDVYFVLATALGCYDLHAAARTLVLNRILRVIGRGDRVRAVDGWASRDLRVARWYAPFFAVGVAVMFAVWFLALIPVMTGMWHLASDAFHQGISSARFWDATVFIAINAAQTGFFAYVALRNRAQGRRADRLGHGALVEGSVS